MKIKSILTTTALALVVCLASPVRAEDDCWAALLGRLVIQYQTAPPKYKEALRVMLLDLFREREQAHLEIPVHLQAARAMLIEKKDE